MALAKHKTIKQALEYVDRNPEWPSDQVRQRLEMPVWELVARNLFDIANNPDSTVIGSVAKATRAQKIILDRLTGTRRAGTGPAVANAKKVVMADLTVFVEPEKTDDNN
jgi:hypothetical protein